MLTEVASLAKDAGAVHWMLASLIMLATGCVQGFTGMGFAVVATPLFVLLFGEPHSVIMFSLLLGSVLGVGVLVETRKSSRIRRAWPLIAGVVLGTLLGVAVLSRVDARGMNIFIAVRRR